MANTKPPLISSIKVLYNIEFNVLAVDHGLWIEFDIPNWDDRWALGGTWVEIGDFD